MSGQDVKLKAFQLTALLIDVEPFFYPILVVSANTVIEVNY